MNPREQPLDVAHGDKALSEQATRALRTIAQHSSSPDLKKQIGDIVSGRASARELMNSEAFNRVLDNVAPNAIRWAAETPAEERQRLADQGRADLDRIRAEPTEWGQQPTSPVDFPGKPATHSPVPEYETPRSSPEQAAPARTSRQSWRDVVVTPDEPDEDDLYFQERHRRGWLE